MLGAGRLPFFIPYAGTLFRKFLRRGAPAASVALYRRWAPLSCRPTVVQVNTSQQVTRSEHVTSPGKRQPMNKFATVPPVKSGEPAAKPIADLREWGSRVEAIGELTKVAQPVDRDEEMSAISYLVAKQQPPPAGLFERPRGFDKSPIGAKMLWNVIGPSGKRVALTLAAA